MLRKGLNNMKTLIARRFCVAQRIPKPYILKRPWDFHHNDYEVIIKQVQEANTTEKVKQAVQDNYGELNEVLVAELLEKMFKYYIEFTPGFNN
jgi:hypothetical protein